LTCERSGYRGVDHEKGIKRRIAILREDEHQVHFETGICTEDFYLHVTGIMTNTIVDGSLLYGMAFILGTSWITATVSCNAIGAVPMKFEFTQSTPFHAGSMNQDQLLGPSWSLSHMFDPRTRSAAM
jgi:hypothetical protein